MPVFVHITDARRAKSVRRSGLRPSRGLGGVYCVPVIDDFMAAHQWSRELKQFGAKNPVAVYFRLPKDAPVRAGIYHRRQRHMTAAQAVAKFLESDGPRGYQVILEGKVPAAAILRIKRLKRPVGWRYFPRAKGHPPLRAFIYRGEYGSRILRARLEAADEAIDPTHEMTEHIEEK